MSSTIEKERERGRGGRRSEREIARARERASDASARYTCSHDTIAPVGTGVGGVAFPALLTEAAGTIGSNLTRSRVVVLYTLDS